MNTTLSEINTNTQRRIIHTIVKTIQKGRRTYTTYKHEYEDTEHHESNSILMGGGSNAWLD
jgi:hypothetical protein